MHSYEDYLESDQAQGTSAYSRNLSDYNYDFHPGHYRVVYTDIDRCPTGIAGDR
ncbi:MAG: hypothetical protein HFJ84_01070 [Clostridiales bacterium]|nr:hypothetical protein [Clostridiales bacterium]